MKCRGAGRAGLVGGSSGGDGGESGDGRGLASDVAERCGAFLAGLLTDLDQHLDARLVRTLAATVTAVVRHRSRTQGLLLSELGAWLAGPEHAPAGTKRLANLLHSRKWQAREIDDYLLQVGESQVRAEAERVPEGRALCILDGSVIEKPESAQLAGLAPVRSSKARRLGRSRPKLGPGYWRGKPGPPVVVPGFSWVAVLVTGWASQTEQRPLTFGAWHWYTKPRPPATDAVPVADAPAIDQTAASPAEPAVEESSDPATADVVAGQR